MPGNYSGLSEGLSKKKDHCCRRITNRCGVDSITSLCVFLIPRPPDSFPLPLCPALFSVALLNLSCRRVSEILNDYYVITRNSRLERKHFQWLDTHLPAAFWEKRNLHVFWGANNGSAFGTLFSISRLKLMCDCVCLRVAVGDSRCVLHLLVRFGDLPVAVDHFYQQPQGQAHQQHIHHDPRVERRRVVSGCGEQTATDMYYSICIRPLNGFLLLLLLLNGVGQNYLFMGLRRSC